MHDSVRTVIWRVVIRIRPDRWCAVGGVLRIG
jgi:hypothetical protein